ncbi:hypothetical protein TNCV_3672061 [Trichonephila clavipes]|nr:hypothetical protein TNCV_3672061 [Trichonephila clavipes]
MYGSTCTDMQVDVMGECLSSIKHNVGVKISISGKVIERRIAVKITSSGCLSEKMANNQSVTRHLDAFTRGRKHWEVGGRPQCDKCGCRVRIAHSIVSRL